MLTWNGDLVANTYIDQGQLRTRFGETWEDFLKEGNLNEIYEKANQSLQRSLFAKSKGKGTGKSKGGQCKVFGINAEDY
eukprot:12417521-Karenia_brevis.AAC.1